MRGKIKDLLPAGIDRLPSGSLRARISVQGMEPETRTFRLEEDSKAARERQLHDATVWLNQTAARMKAGVHVSTREAEGLKVRDALLKLRDEGLADRREHSRKNVVWLINDLLTDVIADRPLANVTGPDIATLRDRLIEASQVKKVDAVMRRLKTEDLPDAERDRRIAGLRSLAGLRKQLADESNAGAKKKLEKAIEAIELREQIKPVARTTITNKVNLINVALRQMGESVHGVSAPVRNVRMPKASPARTRRPSKDEWERLLEAAEEVNPLCPLILRFAVLTALRRERCLTVRLSNISQIADGKQVIHFPKEDGSKKIGIIPVTTEIRAIIDQALAMRQDKSNDRLVFAVPIETFETWFEKSLALAAIEDLHFHDLRHEATSRLFEQGLNMMEVMTITGHTTTEMVERYSHYNCGLIHDKLEKAHLKRSPESILEDIRVMVGRYLEAGGNKKKLAPIISAHVARSWALA